jgi:hypothetical protein
LQRRRGARRHTGVPVAAGHGATGGIKEKQMVSEPGAAAVRFQGTLLTATHAILLDRSTLAPLADGRVRQTIEVSKDGGAGWRVVFDAFYERAP